MMRLNSGVATGTVVFLAGMLLVQRAEAAAQENADHARLIPPTWSRRPVLAVPLLDSEGPLDGQLNWAGWQRSSLGNGLIDPAAGVVPRQATHFRTYWTREALWIGFRVFYPKWQFNPRVTLPAGHHAGAALYSRDDNVEITLVPAAPDALPAPRYALVFVGNSASAWSSQRVSLTGGGGDTNWKPDWSYRAAPTPDGWTGTLKIPFASLSREGVPPLRDGTIWQMEFMAKKVSLANQINSWSNMWFGPEGGFVTGTKGLLRFIEKPVAFQVGSVGRYDHSNRKLAGYRTIILNRGTASETLRLEGWIFRAPKGRPKGKEIFLDLWDKAEIVKAGRKEIDYPAFRSYDQFMRELNEIYVPYRHRVVTTEVKPDGAAYFAEELPLEEGEYIAAFRVSDERGNILGAQVSSYHIAQSLELELTPYPLFYKKFGVTARLGDVPNLATGDVVRCTLRAGDGERTISQAEAAFDGLREELNLYLDAALAPGQYQVHASVASPEGQVRVTQVADLERPPDPEWWLQGRDIGREPLCPWPWTPVQETGGVVALWGRQYAFDGAVLPRSVRTRDAELLAAPMTLTLRAAGRQIELPKTVRSDRTDERVVLAGEKTVAGLTVRARTLVEFDGMMRFDVTLEPIARDAGSAGHVATQVDELTLRVSIPKSYATLLTAGGIGTAVARHKLADNEQGSLDNFFERHPDGTMGFARDCMLLCEDRGIQWFAESDRGWENADPDRVIRVERLADRVTLVVSFVGRPVQLAEPRTFTWGLIVTPVKPAVWRQRSDYLIFAGLEADLPGRTYQKLLRFDEQARQELADELRLYKEHGFAAVHCYLVPMRYFGSPRSFDEEHERLVKRYTDLVHAADLGFQGYGMWGISSRFPGFEQFGKEMLLTPFRNIGFGAYAKTPQGPFPEYHLHGLRHSIRAVGIDGIHVDGGSTPELDSNELAGHRWMRNGEEHGTFPVFAMRDYLKRLYRLFQQECGERARLNFGQGYGPMYYLDCFCDNRGVGEADLHRGHTLAEIFTPARFRAAYLTEPHGLRTTLHWWNWQRPPVTENEMHTITALHNVPRVVSGGNIQLYGKVRSYEPQANPWLQVYKIVEPYRNNGEFRGYWERRWIDAEPPELLVSYYLLKAENRALLVLGNWTAQPMNVRFRIDPARLGLADTAAELRDALLDSPIPQEGSVYTQPMPPQSYRLIEVNRR